MSWVRLRSDVGVIVGYEDRTPFGSPVGSKPEHSVREIFSHVIDDVERSGPDDLVARTTLLVDEVLRGERFASLIHRRDEHGWALREDILYPDPALAPPRLLALVDDDGGRMETNVPLERWPDVHAIIARLSNEGLDPSGISPPLRSLIERLEAGGFLEDAAQPSPDTSAWSGSDLTFLGHNTVVVRSETTQVIVDPMVLPRSARYPEGYQPVQIDQVGRVDAVLITHSHPDHLHPGTLLRFPSDTHLIVPRIDRETLLAVAMERRVRELGFKDVSVMDWWSTTRVGDIDIHALPFHGEQPTEGDRLHAEIRNHGNLYMARTPEFSAAFLADSGRDGQGEARGVAREARKRLGPVDVVFSGYRGWLLYPVQFLGSSVGRYALFVPPKMWTARQRLMITADEALDIAETWGARHLVPYADGGAPWYWERGLGPRLDEEASETPGFDPFPEHVIAAARTRSEFRSGATVSSPVKVLLLRPGDSVQGVTGKAEVVRAPGCAWPYGDRLDRT